MVQYLDGIIALIVLVAGTITIVTARRRGGGEAERQALNTAQSAVDMMRVQVELLTSRLEQKDGEMTALTARIDVLESLISQRYDLSQIQEDLAYVKEKISELT